MLLKYCRHNLKFDKVVKTRENVGYEQNAGYYLEGIHEDCVVAKGPFTGMSSS